MNKKVKGFPVAWGKSVSNMYRELGKAIIDHDEIDDMIQYAIDKTAGHCLYCGKKLYVKKDDTYMFTSETTVDHLIPVSAWGLSKKGNIALACNDCNSSRGTMKPSKYFLSLYKNDIPTLYDTPEEFDEALEIFQAPYIANYQELYKVSLLLLNGNHEKVSLSISAHDNGVDREVVIPIPTNSERFELWQDKTTPDSLKALKNHIVKVSMITNESKLSSFQNALEAIFEELAKLNIDSLDKLSKMSYNKYIAITRKLEDRDDLSTKRVKLGLTYIGIALDNNNLIEDTTILTGIMRQEIDYKFSY